MVDKNSLRRRKENDQNIPEDVLKVKEKLEAETGKKYKYRTPKKDLPSVGELLRHGVPGQETKQKTWVETVGYPVLLALVFALSLLAFHHLVLTNERLPSSKRKAAKLQQQRRFQQQQQESSIPLVEDKNDEFD